MEQNHRAARVTTIATLLMLLTAIGCSPAPDRRDARLAEFARQSVEQQAKQNEEMAQQSKAVVEESSQLAEAAKEMVASDAEARAEMIAAHDRLNGQLNEQRGTIDAGHDALEEERRQIAEQRHRDPIVATSIQTVGLIIACLLPLLVCVFIIRQMSRAEPDDAAVAELLVCELTSDQPRLLPGPSLRPALEHHRAGDQRTDPQADDQSVESELPF
jgi:hypothetical protein